MSEYSNTLKNWKEPRNTTKIPSKKADNIEELIKESQEMEKTLDPELVKLWKKYMKSVVFEINLLRENVGLKIIQTPGILFYNGDRKAYATVFHKFNYDGDKCMSNGRFIAINLRFVDFKNPRFTNLRWIIQLLAHEMTHFIDSARVFNYQKKQRQITGVDFGQLTFRESEIPYFEEKITLSEEEIDNIKMFLTKIGANMEENKNTRFYDLILAEKGKYGGKEFPIFTQNELSEESKKLLNHFIIFSPDMTGIRVARNLDFYKPMVEQEKGKYIYELSGLLDKANQENWLNEGLCDFLGNLIADKILGKVTLKEEKSKEVGYPEYFWKIQNFYNSLDQNQQKEFLHAILLAKFKYNSIAPIYKFFQKFLKSKTTFEAENSGFPRFSIRDIFNLNIFEIERQNEIIQNYESKTETNEAKN